MTPIVHLVCTAHLDPIYKWSWEEGAREAISTFRTAADLLDEFPEFIFNQNESLLYEWVEEYDPMLFERIRELVQAKRWNISGGWYLQPDVNLPSGETIVRCIIEGRRYFSEKFGVRPNVAFNVDSFGHSNGLPQLLRQSGFDLYIIGRPFSTLLELPAPLFRWVGADGSSITTLRPKDIWYRTPHDVFTGEWVSTIEQIELGIQQAKETGQDILVFWGLGNHGGGATRQDLQQIRALLNRYQDDTQLIVQHSTPEAYLNRITPNIEQLPSHEAELQRVFAGAYTSIAPIKRKLRQAESLLASAERWATITWWRYGVSYPDEQLRAAWKRLMLIAFHDVIAGALIEHALPPVNDMVGYINDTARRIVVSRQHAMLPPVAPQPDTIPIYVLNPHGQSMRVPVGINFLRAYTSQNNAKSFCLYDDTGAKVPHQESGGSPVLEDTPMQPFLGFVADVPALSVRRYEVRFEEPFKKVSPIMSIVETDTSLVVDTPHWQATFERESGGLAQLINKKTNKSILTDPIGLEAMADTGHAWGGMERVNFNESVGKFLPMTVSQLQEYVGEELGKADAKAIRVLHQGDVSITIECLITWQWCRASIHYTFFADLEHIDITVNLHMQARQKMIKLVMPFDVPTTDVYCETPYGASSRVADETEHVYQRWLQLSSEGIHIGIANNGQSAFHVSNDGTLGLSLTRGAVHSAWSHLMPLDPNRSYTFMDQEMIQTCFRLVCDDDSKVLQDLLIPLAHELNHPFEIFFAFHTPMTVQQTPDIMPPFITITASNINIGAMKKSDHDDALIIRFVESAGRFTQTTVIIDGLKPHLLTFQPYEIQTWLIKRHTTEWIPCNLLEEI